MTGGSRWWRAPVASGLALLILVLGLSGCSIKKMAMNSLASSFENSGDAFASDNDPELVRDALPFALKTMETLVVDLPDHRGIHLSLVQGFTQYAFAFLQADADYVEEDDWYLAEHLRARALNLYLRGRGYGLRGLEIDHPGISERLLENPEAAVREIEADEIDLLFWTAAAWGSAVTLGQDQPALVADLPVVQAMMRRGLELDETYGGGSIHEVMIGIEALPEAMGGSRERAEEHFRRALEISEGKRPGPYVTMAQSLCIADQDLARYVELLGLALEIDPEDDPQTRLQTIITLKRAEFLLENADLFFLENLEEEEGDTP